MDWLLPFATLLGIWAFLSVLGSERDRRARELDYQFARVNAENARAARIAHEAAERTARQVTEVR